MDIPDWHHRPPPPKPTECRQCDDRGVIVAFNGTTGAWDIAQCPSCVSLQNFKLMMAARAKEEAERARRRPDRIRELAQRVLAAGEPSRPGSDLEGRCASCGHRSCTCDYTASYAYDLAKLILEHLDG